MKYFKKLEGEKIYLSPVNVDDVEAYVKWLNDTNITKYLTIYNSLISMTGERNFLENESTKEFMFAIVRKEGDLLLGNIGLDNIDYKNGRATLGIFIGEEDNLSKGYGSEAIKLIICYAFEELRLHNINLNVFDDNIRAQKAYVKCGFVECGRRHDALYRNGKYHDEIMMEIINPNI